MNNNEIKIPFPKIKNIHINEIDFEKSFYTEKKLDEYCQYNSKELPYLTTDYVCDIMKFYVMLKKKKSNNIKKFQEILTLINYIQKEINKFVYTNDDIDKKIIDSICDDFITFWRQ